MKKVLMLLVLSLLVLGSPDVLSAKSKKKKAPKNPNVTLKEENNKIIVYQMMTRLFGNTVTKNKVFGTREENGVGKFNDITPTALKSLKDLGITHVWYTGVLEHAIMSDYTKYGAFLDDADVVKGRAGSPYAIKDYYDVNPDLAVDVNNRKKEFKALIKRTHDEGMKVLIDFVPNHVARKYASDAKPSGVQDLGASDNTSKAFDPKNNFYYLPGQAFEVPSGYDPLGKNETFKTEDGKFQEFPAKATGNDQFKAQPSQGDWFETVKLNYGVDIQNGRKTYFDPIPDTWFKMRDILIHWVEFGVDGFRCDMAEMVPVEFWGWAIPQVKKVNPEVKFIAEIYNPAAYSRYIKQGKFDYLYDKVGLYDSVKTLIKYKYSYKSANAKGVYWAWKKVNKFHGNMLTFLENHDEIRLASKGFSRDPWLGVPGMALSATLYSGPVMIYFGQEVGEPGEDKEGFQGNDGRTTIFDYWGVPEHQKWVNEGKFDGGKLSEDQKKLRDTYKKLLNLVKDTPAFNQGNVFDLNYINGKMAKDFDTRTMYSFLRYSGKEVYLIVANFKRSTEKEPYNGTKTYIKMPREAWDAIGLEPKGTYKLQDVFLTDLSLEFKAEKTLDVERDKDGIPIHLEPFSFHIFKLTK